MHLLRPKCRPALALLGKFGRVGTPGRPLISLHVPKCAGSSFLGWLTTAYRHTPILTDYQYDPFDESSERLPNGYGIVHGHFWAKKYRNVKNAYRMTFLRHPVERAISHYYYWRSVPLHGNRLHDRFRREDMDILTFARAPQIEGHSRNNFFNGTNMDTFDFIGNTASLVEDVAYLERALGVKGQMPRENANPWSEYASEKARLLGNPDLLKELARVLEGDIEFYESCMRRRHMIIQKARKSYAWRRSMSWTGRSGMPGE